MFKFYLGDGCVMFMLLMNSAIKSRSAGTLWIQVRIQPPPECRQEVFRATMVDNLSGYVIQKTITPLGLDNNTVIWSVREWGWKPDPYLFPVKSFEGIISGSQDINTERGNAASHKTTPVGHAGGAPFFWRPMISVIAFMAAR